MEDKSDPETQWLEETWAGRVCSVEHWPLRRSGSLGQDEIVMSCTRVLSMDPLGLCPSQFRGKLVQGHILTLEDNSTKHIGQTGNGPSSLSLTLFQSIRYCIEQGLMQRQNQ